MCFVFGLCLVRVWVRVGSCLVRVWASPGSCLVRLRFVPGFVSGLVSGSRLSLGSCRVRIWFVSGWCLFACGSCLGSRAVSIWVRMSDGSDSVFIKK